MLQHQNSLTLLSPAAVVLNPPNAAKPFNTVPQAVMTPNHKTFRCHFVTVILLLYES